MHESTPIPPATTRRGWVASLLVIAVAVFVAYHNTFTVPELLDDPFAISENLTIRRLWPLSRPLSPPNYSGVGGRPVANLTFALNYWSSGTDLRGYHATNLAIHLCAALTLFGITRRTLALPRPPAPDGGSGSPPGPSPLARHANSIALTIAVLWGVHPVLTNAVTYLSQRTESLMGLCYLLTLYGFIRSVSGAQALGWMVVSIAACFAGVATKEVMVTAPAIVLLYDRTFIAGSFRAALTTRWPFYLALAASWVLLATLLTTGLEQRQVGFNVGVEWWRYALTECRALLLYLKLGFWPHPLIFDYGPDFLSGRQAVPFATALAALLVATIWAVRNRPPLGFIACWFFVILSPTSSVVPVAQQPIAESRLYLPAIAIVAALTLACFRTLGHRTVPMLVAIGLAFGALAVRRNATYQSALALWADTTAKRPNSPRAIDNYGQALHEKQRYDDAIVQYRRALEINPTSHATNALLGDVYAALNRHQDAATQYVRAINLRPDHANYYNSLAVILGRAGQTQASLEQYTKAVQLDPTFAAAHFNLGSVLYDIGRYADAARHFERAIELGHDNFLIRQKLGVAFLQLGRNAEALTQIEIAVRANPADADVRNNYGAALLQNNRAAEAMPQFEEALRLRPDHAMARANLERMRSAPPAKQP